MQLLLILILLTFISSQSKNPKDNISELLEPETMKLIKEISGGGEQVEEFIREVSQISEIVSVLAPLVQPEKSETQNDNAEVCGAGGVEFSQDSETYDKTQNICEILSPVRSLADDGIYNALARAV